MTELEAFEKLMSNAEIPQYKVASFRTVWRAALNHARRTQSVSTAGIQNIIADDYLAKVHQLVEAVKAMGGTGVKTVLVDRVDYDRVRTLAAQLKETTDE